VTLSLIIYSAHALPLRLRAATAVRRLKRTAQPGSREEQLMKDIMRCQANHREAIKQARDAPTNESLSAARHLGKQLETLLKDPLIRR